MSWRTYKFGDFLLRSKIPIDIEDGQEYKRVTIKTKHQRATNNHSAAQLCAISPLVCQLADYARESELHARRHASLLKTRSPRVQVHDDPDQDI